MEDQLKNEWLRELYERYFDTVAKYCLPKLGFDRDAAADCAHAVFDKAAEKYEKLKTHPNVLGWLIVTAKHVVHKRWTRNVREASRSIPIELAANIPDSRDPFDAVELSDGEIGEITAKVLSGLDEKETALYELCFIRNLPFSEIAEITGMTEKAARAKLARIKLKLKQRIIYFLEN